MLMYMYLFLWCFFYNQKWVYIEIVGFFPGNLKSWPKEQQNTLLLRYNFNKSTLLLSLLSLYGNIEEVFKKCFHDFPMYIFLVFTMYHIKLKIGVSKEQIVILPFAYY